MQLHPASLQFLDAIADHNTRSFFATVRPVYDEINISLQAIAAAMITSIATFDRDIDGLDPKGSLFRIYRDARRLKDGDQIYKHNRGITLSPGGKNSSIPGYYLHIEPGDKSFFACGAYRPEPQQLKKLRNHLRTHGAAYEKLIKQAAFKKMFGAPHGSMLTRPPIGFSADDPYIDLIKYKQHLLYRPITDAEIMSVDIVKWMSDTAKIAYPWIAYLREGME